MIELRERGAAQRDRALRADLPPGGRYLQRPVHRQRRSTPRDRAERGRRSHRPGGHRPGRGPAHPRPWRDHRALDARADRGGRERPVDYISVGPIWETPTKEGRPATGLELISTAAEIATVPWFAIGGIDTENVGEVTAAARRADLRGARDSGRGRPARGGARRSMKRSIRRSRSLMGSRSESAPSGASSAPRRPPDANGASASAPAETTDPPRTRASRADGPPLGGAERGGAGELEPLERGERPTAVTVGAIVSVVRRDIHRICGDRRTRVGRGLHSPVGIAVFAAALWVIVGDVEDALLGGARISGAAPDRPRRRPRAGRRLDYSGAPREPRSPGGLGRALLLHDPGDGPHPDAAPAGYARARVSATRFMAKP